MKWDAAKCAELERLLLQFSYTQAAKLMGVSKGSVAGAIAHHGIGRKPYDRSLKVRPRSADKWDESRLTERWADRKARLARERSA